MKRLFTSLAFFLPAIAFAQTVTPQSSWTWRDTMSATLLLITIGLLVYIFRLRNAHVKHVEELGKKHEAQTASLLQKKRSEISHHQTAISDSINYAKKIQDSILPPDSLVHRILPDSFILYLPKDVVSGDFYWVEQCKGMPVFAAVDCTGHGVPGALMSVIGFNLLTQAVNEMQLTKPSDILHHLDFGVNKFLRQSDEGGLVKDGMDLAMCTLDPATRQLQYAGVFNPAYVITKNELVQLKADKFPIGINTDGITDNYTNQTMLLDAGDMIYLFSDGFADQFGGPKGKKYMYNQFRQFLLYIHTLPVEEQRRRLLEEFHRWKGQQEQVDDVLVIGVRVN